ncbi:MAG: CxxC-x17-CxxC domain-containing protein [Chloroflexota bacterium]|nr:CxxC-x17-CxxC domain-containing protein [Chloroflexota bacterium]
MTLECYDCGATYTFSSEEQEQFHQIGHRHPPKRCPACRAARKARQSNSSGNNRSRRDNTTRQMFPAVCAACGKETEVPFQPRGDRPVYCRECYSRVARRR